ncbi:MAG: alpha/beta fold hydrolase [Dehalococcoidia bacterium]
MDRMTVDGLEMAYRVAGDPSGPPITLIHGYTGNTRNYALQIKPLTEAGWRTLTADNPGHGSSAGEPRRPYNHEDGRRHAARHPSVHVASGWRADVVARLGAGG